MRSHDTPYRAFYVPLLLIAVLMIETSRVLLALQLDYDDLFYRALTTKPSFGSGIARFAGVAGLNDTIFDECRLVSNPTWTEEVRRVLNPAYSPIAGCNRSYEPWSRLGADGRVSIRAGFADASCRARALLRESDWTNAPAAWHDVQEGFVFEDDIIEVECVRAGRIDYRFLHSQIRGDLKKSAENATESEDGKKPRSPSVYIMLMDSFAASAARRSFPKTLAYLKKTFGAIDMNHLNKVGENSRPNAFPLLFGKSVASVYKGVYGLPNIPADLTDHQSCYSFLDDRGFILDEYGKSGYKTMFAEDWSNGVFNDPDCKGFDRQPTTHYMRPFQLTLKQSPKQLDHHQGKRNCFEFHHFLNDYLAKFLRAYPGTPKMALVWDASLAHNYANDPFHADADYLRFFEENKEEIDNSFLFFMGDHGLRFGKVTDTPVGQRDYNNPMALISLPKDLRSNHALATNLAAKADQLITMYDLHSTFEDILQNFKSGEVPSDLAVPFVGSSRRGASLLRPLPPGARNCKTLPIPPQFCICQQDRQDVEITPAHEVIGQIIASAINEQLRAYGVLDRCAQLSHQEITELQLVVGSAGLHRATVRLLPGGGLFQTYVSAGADGSFAIASPDVVRMDEYGSSADCMTIGAIKSLCYCQKQDWLRYFASFLPS